MKLNLTNRSRGLTLTELLVVMLILGLLATIAIPVYTRRQEDARIRVAMSECREIAMAEEQCAIVHGFYVPFQVLDDLPVPPTGVSGGTNAETLDNEPNLAILYVIDPLTRAEDEQNNQHSLSEGQNRTNARVANLFYNWNGPWMNFQRFYYGVDQQFAPGSVNYNNSTVKFLDFPLDPWGNPYRFYSALGLIGTDALTFTPGTSGLNFSDGVLTNNDRRFDRYAVVSFGRDGTSDTDFGNATTNPNDIFYLFGSNGVESTFGRNF